jgi:hypothetical protein
VAQEIPRKRRTKAEIEANKAAAPEAKKQQEDKVKATDRWMAQINMDEDKDQAERGARTIRRLSDIQELDQEEFVGYDDVSLTESDEPEDIKVGKLSHLRL